VAEWDITDASRERGSESGMKAISTGSNAREWRTRREIASSHRVGAMLADGAGVASRQDSSRPHEKDEMEPEHS